MRQERNALAVALRQHGFLGRRNISRTTVHAAQTPGPSGPPLGSGCEQDSQEGTFHDENSPGSGSSSAASHPACLSQSPMQTNQRQPHVCSEDVHIQVPDHDQLPSGQVGQRHTSSLQDISNLSKSQHTSHVDAGNSAPDSASRSGHGNTAYRCENSPESHQSQSEAMQARLRGLEEMAHTLLM